MTVFVRSLLHDGNYPMVKKVLRGYETATRKRFRVRTYATCLLHACDEGDVEWARELKLALGEVNPKP
jgi:hypothetical protein